MTPEPDDVLSNTGGSATTGKWLRAMADMEHEEHTDEEPDHETGPDPDRT